MAYEIDFIGVGSDVKKDADAIAIRWRDESDIYHIGIYDGGLQAHGEKMVEHINQYYFENENNISIDFVICSHSDADHTSGLKYVLENLDVKALYMNRPWLYVDDIIESVNIELTDGRITPNSLTERLREKYKYICELEEIATEKEIPIYSVFQGDIIEERLTVLSPTREMYLQLMVESEKTPIKEVEATKKISESFIGKAFEYIKSLIETWKKEELKEGVSTSAENEMSVILLGRMTEENFLLTGDGGLRALGVANDYSQSIGISIRDTVRFIQVPHHGGRHNISPSMLNTLIGEIVEEGEEIKKVAFVSVAKDSDHPLQMVVNAFTRRGVKVYKTSGNIIHHHKNMPDRDGWTTLKKMEFSRNVEEW